MYLTRIQHKMVLGVVIAALIVAGAVILLRPKVDDRYGVPVPISLGTFISAADARYKLDTKLPRVEFETTDGKARLLLGLRGVEYTNPRKKNQNTVVYEEVLPGVDVEYLAYENKIKENIIVKERNAPISFTFDLQYVFAQTDSFDIVRHNDILLSIYDTNTNEELIQLDMPYAYDANGEFIAYRYRFDKEKQELILEPNRKRELENKLVDYMFPITIDPPVSVRQCDEILVRIGENGKDPAIAKDGDIVAIKPCGWPWGNQEKRDYVIIRVQKLTNEDRIEYTSTIQDTVTIEERGLGIEPTENVGAQQYGIDYTLLATESQLADIRRYDKENPILNATDFDLSTLIQHKKNPSISLIPESRRLAGRIDQQIGLFTKIANRLIKPALAATTNTYTIGSGTCGVSACDYSTMTAWEAARNGNLVAADTIEKGEMYNNSVFTDQIVYIEGSTTDSTRYMWLTAAVDDRHDGTAGTGVRIDSDSNTSQQVIDVNDDYTIVEWLEVYDSTPGATTNTYGLRAQEGSTWQYLIVHDIGGSTSGGSHNSACFTSWTTSRITDENIYNSIFYNCRSQGIQMVREIDIYNVTSFNNYGYGIMDYSGSCNSYTCDIQNNIAMDNDQASNSAADFDSGYGGGDDIMKNNLSSDGTADDCGTCGTSTGNVVNKSSANQFISTVTPDLRLKAGSYAIDNGVDLSGTFTDDIDSDTRSYTWDIGADEYVGTIVETNNAVTSGTASNFSFTHGLTINENDVVVAIIHANTTGQTILDDNGANSFTEAIEEQNGSQSSRYGIFYRVAGASEPSAYAFDFDGVGITEYVAMFRVFDGVDTTSVWDVAPSVSTRNNGTSGTSVEAPTMTTSNDGAMGILAVFSDSSNTFSNPTNGYVAELEDNTEATANYIRTFASAGVTGAASSTLSASNDWTAQQFALKPTSGAVNNYPTITSVTDSPDPVEAGNSITFSVDWNDADAGDQTRSFICKTDAFASSTLTCSGGYYTSSTSFATTDPATPSYTTVVGDIGTNNYYAFVCDDDNYCSASTSGSFEVTTPAATAIYRSVGNTTSEVASTTASGITLSIANSVATFSSGVPNNVGVGDVIQYDSDNNGSIDSITFIHGRTSSSTYAVKGSIGENATSTSAADADWEVFRAYTTMSNAEAGTENTGINATYRDFDTGNKDITVTTGSNEQWNFALYDDATDSSAVTINGWTTATSTYMRFYTPTSTTEVGVSQRHVGKWGTSGYVLQLSNGAGITISDDHVRIDGIRLEVGGDGRADDNGIIMTSSVSATESEFIISNNVIRGVFTGGSEWNNGIEADAGYVIKIFNNIIYDFVAGTNDNVGIQVTPSNAAYIYNNTVYNCYYGIEQEDSGTVVAINNLVQSATDGFVGTFSSSDYNLSNLSSDAPSASYRNGLASTVTFAGEDQDNFHLDPMDTIAQDAGTDLSGDSNLSFSHDINNEKRQGSYWDIGADETRTLTQIKGGVNIQGDVNFK